MTNKIILKKSVTANKVPLLTDLDYGELAINYNDGKLYYRKSDGVTPANDTINSISGGGTGSAVYINASAPVSPAAGDMWWDSTSGSLKIYYSDANTSQWVDAYSPSINGGITPTLMIDGGSSTTAYTAADMVLDGGSA